jgi:hypothetical protein
VSATVVALSAPAAASPLDIVGLGARHAGEANAGLAAVDDATALYYNPAGLVRRPECTREVLPEGDHDESLDPSCAIRDRGDLIVGVAGAYSHLAIDGLRAPFADAGGAQLAGRVRLANRFAVGFAFHGPSQGGEHAVVRDPQVPLYPYYRDRLSRPVLLVGAAADLGRGKSLGVAFDLAAGVAHAKAIVGATVPISQTLAVGIVWRQRFAIVDEPTGARVHYTPHTVLAGVTLTNDAVRASLDAGFAHWSAYEGPFATSTTARVRYTSCEQVRFGLESNKDAGIAFRIGYALETAAIPEAQADANLLDGFKQTVAGGASYAAGRMRIDAQVATQIVSTRTMTMPDDSTLKSGGEIFMGGLSLAVSY